MKSLTTIAIALLLQASASLAQETLNSTFTYKVDVEYTLKGLLQASTFEKSWIKNFQYNYYYNQYDDSGSVSVFGISASWAMTKIEEAAQDDRVSNRQASDENADYDPTKLQIFRAVRIYSSINGYQLSQESLDYVGACPSDTPPSPFELEQMAVNYTNYYMLPPDMAPVTVPKLMKIYPVVLTETRQSINNPGIELTCTTDNVSNSGTSCPVSFEIEFYGTSQTVNFSVSGLNKEKSVVTQYSGNGLQLASTQIKHFWASVQPGCKGAWKAAPGGVQLNVNGLSSVWYLPGYSFENKAAFYIAAGEPNPSNPIVCSSGTWCLLQSETYPDEYLVGSKEEN